MHSTRNQRLRRGAAILTIAALPAVGAAQPADDEIGIAVYVGDAMVKPYWPTPTLVVPERRVPAAKFPAIDIHCHWTIREDPTAMLRAMDERNVLAAVNLSGRWGDDLDRMVGVFGGTDPDRLLTFCNVDFSQAGDPDFAERWTAELRRAHGMGVRGLKVFKTLGLVTRDASGELVAVDDPRLDPIWRTCGEHGMPVLIHTGDPAAFFDPIDEHNERWMQLQRHPDWSFHGPEFPELDEVLAQRDRMMARHPRTTFIGPHIGSAADDLVKAAAMLDANPNLVLDISGRVAALGRQPYSARRFILKYQDRILFGTDRFPGRTNQPRYRIYYRFLETDDEYFQYYDHPFPPTGEWRIYGIFLPDDVLKKVYHDNAARVLGMPTLADLADREPARSAVPDHPRRDELLGTWAHQGEVGFAIERGPDDAVRIRYREDPQNVWDTVVTDVRWEDDTLRFSTHTYFNGAVVNGVRSRPGEHPFHGAQLDVTLEPADKPGRLTLRSRRDESGPTSVYTYLRTAD